MNTLFSSFLLLSALLSLVASQCPNSCSYHGTCSASFSCVCDDGWGGDDCSISDTLLINGVTQHGIVGTRSWKYYHIQANSDSSSLVIEVNQTSISGDCDIYIRLNNYPTRQVYDSRDISSSKTSRTEIVRPNGVYYVGVYGFLGAEFDIRASMKTSCPRDCNGHGKCSPNGVCQCVDGFTGADCSTPIYTMRNNTQYSGRVEMRQWNYYAFSNTFNTFVLTLNQTGDSSEDCDLYVKFGDLPNLTYFGYRDTTMSANIEMKITEAKMGVYNVGVYGFKSCSYNIRAISVNQCPNQCSGAEHGTCLSTTACRCNSRFSGLACETMISALGYGAPVTGFVGSNFWNYYHFRPYSSSNVIVSLRQDSLSMDCDLYVKKQTNPSRFDFDYRDISFNQNNSVLIESPAFVDYYIGAFGYKDCSYTLTVTLSQSCLNGCTGPTYGTCQSGHCVCKDGWTGDDCSVPSNSLVSGSTISSVVVGGSWMYYSFRAKANYEVTLFMRESSSTGILWLFESRVGFPSMSSYDISDTETNSAAHRIAFTPQSDVTVQVGVYASPLSYVGHSYDFKLVAWQASFDGVQRSLPLEQSFPSQ